MPNNVLAEIVTQRRVRVAEMKLVEQLPEQLPPSDRSLITALRAKGPQFIMECKRASPSKGLLRAHYDLPAIVKAYNRYASAISVLTEPDYFQGSDDHLRVVAGLTELPILCKDFIVDGFQVRKARQLGADAILLMLSVLNDQEYQELSAVADSLNMDVLTEVHSLAELQRAQRLGAQIIGINNRDLISLDIDLSTTEQLAPLINNDAVIVSESGVESYKNIQRLKSLVDAFLVGSSLMAAENLATQCKRLRFGDTKICGLTDVAHAQWADEAGAIYGGLIFYPGSPRHIELAQAKLVAAHTQLLFVGVFVEQSVAEIEALANSLSLFAVQLHGKQDDEFIAQLRQMLASEVQIWRALPHSVLEQPNTIMANLKNCDRIVIDKQSEAAFGGTGETYDWQMISSDLPSDAIGIAGGINPDNIVSARKQWPGLLDINSGVESSPGKKDREKINELYHRLGQI